MEEVARYLSIRSAYGASVRDDGDELAFLLDTTGHAEVWTVDAPRTWPTQRTFGEDQVRFCSYVPDGTDLVFGRDDGGNERVQFHRLDPASGSVSPLTDRPDAKHYWGGWANDGERFTFSSNRRDRSTFDVYVQSIDGTDARRISSGDGWFVPAGFGPRDERIVVRELRSTFENDLYVLDVEEESLTCLTADETARFQSPQWGPDGEGIYCVSDVDRDTLALVRIDVATETIDVVASGGRWNVDGVAVDQDSGRIVYTRNVDGSSAVRTGTIDGTTITDEAEPSIPDGVVGGVSFDGAGERFAITHSSRTANPSVQVVGSEGRAERWTAASTAGIPPDTFREPAAVRIASFDGRDVPALLTLPEEESSTGHPVVVDIHGGPASQRRPSFHRVNQFLLASGYAVLEPNVRGSTGYGKHYAELDDGERRMDAVADVAACADWVAEHERIDSERIVAKGGSYGGFMVLAALTEYPDRWAAGVDIVGIANFVSFLENTGSWRRPHREAEYGSLADDRAFLESISPINHVDQLAAPLFVIHGENDTRVPVEEAEQIAEAASDHVPVETLIFPDEGHGILKLENRIEAYTRMRAFLDTHV